MAYIKLMDSKYGEIGHNGYGFVVGCPIAAEDAGNWRGNAVECAGENGWRGLELGHEHAFALVEVPGHLLDAGRTNRADFDARHNLSPVGGIDQVRGGAYDPETY